MKRFWNFKAISNTEVELRIEGDIVDDDDVWLYEWFEMSHTTPNRFREELNKHKGKNIVVWIDTLGGSVWAASGIYNALKEHDGKVTVKINKALSAGSIIAMAGDEVLMGPVGTMMIHNPWVEGAVGDAAELRRVADYLDETAEGIINAYAQKTKLSRDEIARLMREETWMSAHKAVELGFADGILYTEETENEPPEPAAYAISRLAIQNKAVSSMRRFFSVAAKARNAQTVQCPDLSMQLELLRLGEVID